MSIRIANVVFDTPGATLDVYARRAGGVAAMYADLLGMRLQTRGDLHRELGLSADEGDDVDPLVFATDEHGLNIAFECETGEYHAPKWPDPAYPSQVHLDITIPDLAAAHELVTNDPHAATILADDGDHRVYADVVGHPFCLFVAGDDAPPRIERIVFDCFSPRAMARFYAELLEMPERILDTPTRVEIARADGRPPALAFQHVVGPAPRWPDPAHPQQVHIDLDPDDTEAAHQLAERLGAIRLPYRGGGFVYADPAGHPFCLGE